MDVEEKLRILADAAKYDVSCSSSGVETNQRSGTVGNTAESGICHSFSSDGRCISLLKILLTNSCIFDCAYCINRRSNQRERACFTPEEVAQLTIDFYMRNYIEGLFLSSAIIKSPDYTAELMIKALKILRETHGFRGYIHVKAIPGADPQLIDQLALLSDRLSVNIELPTRESLALLAPEKTPESVLRPMKQIAQRKKEFSMLPAQLKKKQPSYAPAGQSTQMIIGATEDSDYHIVQTTEKLYHQYKLKRVFFSAYIPVADNPLLPAITSKPPLLREHRLYQADWLMRFYQFKADEILTAEKPHFNLYLDPKANWAIQNYDYFPLDVQTASYHDLLRVPGIGPKSAKRIITARKHHKLGFTDLKQLGVVVKRAQYFLACSDPFQIKKRTDPQWIISALISRDSYHKLQNLNTQTVAEQLTLFDPEQLEDTMNVQKG